MRVWIIHFNTFPATSWESNEGQTLRSTLDDMVKNHDYWDRSHTPIEQIVLVSSDRNERALTGRQLSTAIKYYEGQFNYKEVI